MNDSFVFHADFIDHLPEEYIQTWTMYAVRYGIYGIVPKFDDPLHAELWRKIKTRIDTDRGNYKERVEYINQYNAYRKALKNGSIPSDTTFESFKTFKTFKTFNTNENISNNSTDTSLVYVSDNVSVSEYVSEYEYVSDNVSDASPQVDATYPSVRTMADSIFNKLKDAHLPCNKGNPITFLQMDFANGMRHIHKTPELKGLHSDEIIGAVENYIKVLKDEDSYLTKPMNFYSLVKSKIFYDLLPSNFNADSFKKYDAENKQQKKTSKIYMPDVCPNCSKPLLFWNAEKDVYICDGCHAEHSFDSIMGDYL